MKYLTSFLIAAFLLAAFSVTCAQATTVENPTKPADLITAGSGAVEITALRTQTAKTFANPDGSRTWKEIAGTPVHYTDQAGKWQETDVAILPLVGGQGSFAYGMTKNAYRSFFAADASSSILAKFATGDWSLSFGIEGGRKGDVAVKGNTITYRNALKGADLRYTTNLDQLREDIILHSSPAKAQWIFPLHMDGVTLTEAADGSLRFVDLRTGKSIWSMPKPFMDDAAGNHSDAVTKTLVTRGGKTYLVVTADKKWLSAPGRAYPVTVDPTTWGPNEPDRDAEIKKQDSGTVVNGTATTMRSGYTTVDFKVYRALVGFSFVKPADATIHSSALTLTQTASGTAVFTVTANVMTDPGTPPGPWTETNATWNLYNTYKAWGPGLSCAISLGTRTWNFTLATCAAQNTGLTTQEYLDTYAWLPYGVMMINNESNSTYWKTFASREDSTTVNRPTFSVTYTEACGVPIITVQPTAQTACDGGKAIFSITAHGNTPSYLWKVSTNGTDWSDAPGLNTNASYTTDNCYTSDSGKQYKCMVTTNCDGGSSLDSDAATLTVNEKPTAEANGPYVSTDMTPVAISGSATNATSTLWKTGGSGAFDDASALSTNYTPSAADVINGSVTLTLEANGAAPCAKATDTATLTLTATICIAIEAAAPTWHGDVSTVCPGVTTAITETPAGSLPITYQWQISANGGTSFTNCVEDIDGDNVTSATMTTMGTAVDGTQYRCVVSNCVDKTATSSAVTLTVNDPTAAPVAGIPIIYNTAIVWKWEPVTQADSYMLWKDATSTDPADLLADSLTATSYLETGLSANTLVARWVEAIDTCGNPSPRTELDATTLATVCVENPSFDEDRFVDNLAEGWSLYGATTLANCRVDVDGWFWCGMGSHQAIMESTVEGELRGLYQQVDVTANADYHIEVQANTGNSGRATYKLAVSTTGATDGWNLETAEGTVSSGNKQGTAPCDIRELSFHSGSEAQITAYLLVVSQVSGFTTACRFDNLLLSPGIITQPTSGAMVYPGSSKTFSVVATDNGNTYLWQVSTNGGSAWNPAPGANNEADYTISPVAFADNGNQYRCLITGTVCNTGIITSSVATVTVNAEQPVTTVVGAKALTDGTAVSLSGPVVTRSFGSFFYVEDASRASGIKAIVAGPAPAQGAAPIISATLGTVSGERVLLSAVCSGTGTGAIPEALGMNNTYAAEDLPWGLLVTAWGTASVPEGATDTFTISDGSYTPVTVKLYGVALPSNGAVVSYTGTLGAGPTLHVK